MQERRRSELTRWIKRKGLEKGFFAVGVAPVSVLERERRYLASWLQRGFHGTMAFMERYFEIRTDPRLLLPEARSVIVFLHDYYQGKEVQQPKGSPRIARYAWGKDYHHVLKRKLYELKSELEEEIGSEFGFRICVDSAPIMEKVWAQRAGLGWIGKHTNLIVPKHGSYFFIAVVVTNLELEYDSPFPKDYCRRCQRCLEVCPTRALKPFELDASRCISYLTIEHKGSIPEKYRRKLQGWVFGCDLCQEVCPWNRHQPVTLEEDFMAKEEILTFRLVDWLKMEKREFKKWVRDSAIRRVRWDKWREQLEIVAGEGVEPSTSGL